MDFGTQVRLFDIIAHFWYMYRESYKHFIDVCFFIYDLCKHRSHGHMGIQLDVGLNGY